MGDASKHSNFYRTCPVYEADVMILDWPDEAVRPDSDPQDSEGHGTHVAGIVAGNGDWFKGVAPEATILAYKVFGLGVGNPQAALNIMIPY